MSSDCRMGSFRLLERISAGRTSEVFRATHPDRAGCVAVKRLRPHWAADDRVAARFFEEARTAAALYHPHIARVYDFGRCDDGAYMAMEFVDGRDLSRLKTGLHAEGISLPPSRACRWASEIADALHHTHQTRDDRGRPLNLVHRDVSPHNVLVSKEGQAKLCDFGAAAPARVTRGGERLGKFAYMSPEQIAHGRVDARSDQFSLGIVLHEMLTGDRLFLRTSDYATLRAVRSAPIPDLGARFSRELQQVLSQLLSRNPQDRFPSLSLVKDVLLRCADHLAHRDDGA